MHKAAPLISEYGGVFTARYTQKLLVHLTPVVEKNTCVLTDTIGK
jgi:hypothetical protein